MKCDYCGHLVDNDSTFCKYCGHKLNKIYICDTVYIARHWFIQQEPGLDIKNRYFSSSHYFLYQESAFYCFKSAYGRAVRHKGETRNGKEKVVSHFVETDETKIVATSNSVDNTLKYWEEYYISPDQKISSHTFMELSVASLSPSINLRIGERGRKLYLFQYQEYSILDDSENHHRGYVSVSEFYSSLPDAFNRINSSIAKYSSNLGYSIEKIWDNRSDWVKRFNEADSENNVYGVCLMHHGHSRMLLHVFVSYCNDDNSFEMLYL